MTASTTLDVRGMTCGHCVKSVEKALRAIDGVADVNVDLGSGKVTVEHDPARATAQSLIAAVVSEGYEAST